ncbi:YegP family protein [Phytohalomonas tamaricis]|uniref:hypothetical protein n=1 Tax=Phytohalomonas tamaricis TaxID=2081032 RepID=UPI000D0B2452|nr:hypothetical protein [Phytohalomonas tamaricis]
MTMRSEWEFYQGDDGQWYWKAPEESEHTTSRGFASREACVEDAKAHGFDHAQIGDDQSSGSPGGTGSIGNL